MDGKPQRPRAVRPLNENAAGVTTTNKTLHSRTRSQPTFSGVIQSNAAKAIGVGKKILGEANRNRDVLKTAKDDLEVGKVSPGKLAAQEASKTTTAALSRPAIRAFGAKSTTASSSLLAPITQSVFQQAFDLPLGQGPVRTLAVRGSTKTLKEAPLNIAAPSIPEEADESVVIETHEVHKTESVPLREESVAEEKPTALNSTVENATVEASAHAASEPPSVSEVTSESVDDVASNALTETFSEGDFSVASPGLDPYPAFEDHRPSIGTYFDPGQYEHYIQEQATLDDLARDEGYTTSQSFGMPVEETVIITAVVPPTITEEILQELELAKIFTESHRSSEEIEDDEWDTSMVSEYSEEIFAYMYQLESRLSANPRYMDTQTEIQWPMRAVLMDWVVQVHQRFNLLPETLFLAGNLIDRFLSVKVVSLGKLQLVGATAIFVAAKYEEVQCPTINEIIYMVDGGYSAEELIKAERFMLTMLQFELGWPGPMSFLRRISKADDYDLETRTLAKYFLEVTIMDARFVGCPPSFLAAGAHCLARLMLRKGGWTDMHVHYSQYTFGQLMELLDTIVECCEYPQSHHTAVYHKYADKRYKYASNFVGTELQAGFKVPQQRKTNTPTSSLISTAPAPTIQYPLNSYVKALLGGSNQQP